MLVFSVSFRDSLSVSFSRSFVCCWCYLNIAVKYKGKPLKNKCTKKKWEEEIAERHACVQRNVWVSNVLASYSIKSDSFPPKRKYRTLLRRHNWNKFDMRWLCMIAFFLFCGSRSNSKNSNALQFLTAPATVIAIILSLTHRHQPNVRDEDFAESLNFSWILN